MPVHCSIIQRRLRLQRVSVIQLKWHADSKAQCDRIDRRNAAADMCVGRRRSVAAISIAGLEVDEGNGSLLPVLIGGQDNRMDATVRVNQLYI